LTIQFAPTAEAEFRELIEYVVVRDPIAAARLAARIFDVIDGLASGEFDGPEQRLTTGEVVHSWAVPPIRIYYQRRAATLHVLRIYHQSQRPIVK
jgi:plasmid stabilization system protein ParE